MKPALLVIDPQNDFFAGDNPNLAEFQATIPVINAAIALFREQQWPVVFVQHTSPNKPIGSYAWAISKLFDCQLTDTQFSKTHYNAFWNTDLNFILKAEAVDFVVVCGYVAEYCVLSTLRGALERGYRGAILEHSIASLNNLHTQLTWDISPHITFDDLYKESTAVPQQALS